MRIIDNHGREVTYMRLAVTDRCNLRCMYCMPEKGMSFAPRHDLLSFEEIWRLCNLIRRLGISKLRITGGEPFMRKDLDKLLARLADMGFAKISITSNGILLGDYLNLLKTLGINHINLSLDTLDRQKYLAITKRDKFQEVWKTLQEMLNLGFVVKVNMVVMDGVNDDEILTMAELARKWPIQVRFIEEMPFNGGAEYKGIRWDFSSIVERLKTQWPSILMLPYEAGSTVQSMQIPNFQGNLGVIAAYTRSFCGTCNRLRVTPQGTLKTCLYDRGSFSIRNMMRQGSNDEEIAQAILFACSHRAKDGHEAEKARVSSLPYFESMATIGG